MQAKNAVYESGIIYLGCGGGRKRLPPAGDIQTRGIGKKLAVEGCLEWTRVSYGEEFDERAIPIVVRLARINIFA